MRKMYSLINLTYHNQYLAVLVFSVRRKWARPDDDNGTFVEGAVFDFRRWKSAKLASAGHVSILQKNISGAPQPPDKRELRHRA